MSDNLNTLDAEHELDPALAELLRVEQRAQWLRENAAAIAAYNQLVEAEGTFGDSVKKF